MTSLLGQIFINNERPAVEFFEYSIVPLLERDNYGTEELTTDCGRLICSKKALYLAIAEWFNFLGAKVDYYVDTTLRVEILNSPIEVVNTLIMRILDTKYFYMTNTIAVAFYHLYAQEL